MSKATTSDYLRLDVRYLQRNRLLRPGNVSTMQWSRNGEPCGRIQLSADFDRVVLIYQHRRAGQDWQHETYPVRLERTKCNFGGERVWFRCPALGCGRRVAVLYSGGIFACRRCHDLAYDSQHEAKHERALHKAQAIRMRLGGTANMTDDFPPKPKRMHWRTYRRLFQTAERAEQRSWPPWLLRRLSARN